MSQQNNQNNKTNLDQYKEDLQIFQDAQSNLKVQQEGFTQTENWFDQICGVQKILSLEHAQACLKFRDFLKEQELKQSDIHIQQQNQQILFKKSQKSESDVLIPFKQKIEQEFKEYSQTNNNQNRGIGHYLLIGVGALIAFKITKRIIFGKAYANGGIPVFISINDCIFII
ncbi:transmembrane protein, putative (macronuclear) [Tetrahymena thermophila SB210]|uniref:Transmembrane protein, putative n=1 Tax=Tetrahymena thermophila (strain SB210) TaxID=312017 RepID=Q24DH6_TETTS|nr:transmembrane protein, putative [Tetrahymena thermophila SB210]EAS05872.1 transmembrane protein, putative [Tetrahymena thermophila SB210]|eukprot:XP_001026117.1 transmembrane protein, putative [Tetrahymena thermophila SB210]